MQRKEVSKQKHWAKLSIQPYLCNSTCVLLILPVFFTGEVFKWLSSLVQKSSSQFSSYSSLAICNLLGSWIRAEGHHSRMHHITTRPRLCCFLHPYNYSVVPKLYLFFLRKTSFPLIKSCLPLEVAPLLKWNSFARVSSFSPSCEKPHWFLWLVLSFS